AVPTLGVWTVREPLHESPDRDGALRGARSAVGRRVAAPAERDCDWCAVDRGMLVVGAAAIGDCSIGNWRAKVAAARQGPARCAPRAVRDAGPRQLWDVDAMCGTAAVVRRAS